MRVFGLYGFGDVLNSVRYLRCCQPVAEDRRELQQHILRRAVDRQVFFNPNYILFFFHHGDNGFQML